MAKKSKKESTLYYFHSTGCGFCKQIDPIIEKLNKEGYDILSLDMAEKDNQGLHREIENKYDLRCGTPFLVDGSNGNNICGQQQANEETIKKWADGEKIPKLPPPPKPKGPPPPLPKNWYSDDEIKNFKEKYDKWKEENNHVPTLQTSEQIVDRFKNQIKNRISQPQPSDGHLSDRVTLIEQKLDRLMNHLGVK